ncbi:hypothetical protein BJ912DRAFT_1070663 [Pholiota molesta]|nr:hypothetical protein BJ912DRAFT_1070663 [Pholiota molesta]
MTQRHDDDDTTKEREERARGDPGAGDPQGTPPMPLYDATATTPSPQHDDDAPQPPRSATGPIGMPHHPHTTTTTPHRPPRRPAAHDTTTTAPHYIVPWCLYTLRVPRHPRCRAAAPSHDDNAVCTRRSRPRTARHIVPRRTTRRRPPPTTSSRAARTPARATSPAMAVRVYRYCGSSKPCARLDASGARAHAC